MLPEEDERDISTGARTTHVARLGDDAVRRRCKKGNDLKLFVCCFYALLFMKSKCVPNPRTMRPSKTPHDGVHFRQRGKRA